MKNFFKQKRKISNNYQNPKKEAGFTLVELLVSIALFTVASVAMITALYTINSSWRKVQAMATVMDNLNFAIESMSRTIRTADNIGCGDIQNQNCDFYTSTGSSRITLHSTLGGNMYIRYGLGYDAGVYGIQKSVSTDGSNWSAPVSLTSPGLSITNLSFYVDGADLYDNYQPNVKIMLTGEAKAGGQVTPFAIQTLVTQRNME